jgi:hypothetical protein
MEHMQMEQQDLQKILQLLSDQSALIGRMDERQMAMRDQISEFRTDITNLGARVQSVENTAFRNAVIMGFVGAGMGSVITLIAGKLIG